MGIVLAIASGFLIGGVAPLLNRLGRGHAGWLLTLLPLALLVYFASFIPRVISGESIVVGYRWVPSLDLNLFFRVDGLSLLFALLITGIGAVVVLYSGRYLSGHPHLGRFYCIILIFMASMLGLVLASNLLVLFLFWELTSISSYLLVGFDHHREGARQSALQALLVTGGGGLALLAGILLLGSIGNSFDITQLIAQGDQILGHPLAVPSMLLIMVGAFTKSAQVPFHFWLPNAMEAPTPVSAYLHSATMVKAGVYLLARMSPVYSDSPLWLYILTAVGATTMITGAVMALGQTDLKRILAYTTISKLGILVALIGLGTELAIKAAIVILFAHALYKAALFLVAGTLDHETGTRQMNQLGGLRRNMPITAITAGLAAASMASIPPLLGFIGKEKFYEAALESDIVPMLVTAAAVLTSILLVAASGYVAVKPYWGRALTTPKHPHEAPFQLWIGPIILAVLGLVFGLAPGLLFAPFLSAVVSAVLGESVKLNLALWSGFNFVLLLTVVSIIIGLLLYIWREPLRIGRIIPIFSRRGPESLYELSLSSLNRIATWLTHFLQSGYIRHYVILVMLSTVGLVGYTLISKGGLEWPAGSTDLRFYEVAIAALILLAAGAAALLRSRLAAAAALGVTGYGVAIIFIFFGAPDLAMTQILIETLTVILFVLVFYHLPPPIRLSAMRSRLRDGVVALSVGVLMTALVLVAAAVQFQPPISEFFADTSVPIAHGRNIVNVILVDFRALDTLGEIIVLAIAAIGVYALLKLVREKK